MIRVSRSLLSAVNRLLILADLGAVCEAVATISSVVEGKNRITEGEGGGVGSGELAVALESSVVIHAGMYDDKEARQSLEAIMSGAALLSDSTCTRICDNDNEFIDALHLVYEGVREVGRAVLINWGEKEMVDSDTEWEEEADTSEIVFGGRDQPEYRSESVMTEMYEYPEITNASKAMKKLLEEEKEKIMQQVEVFGVEKRALDREVSKWDDLGGKEVIILAKHKYRKTEEQVLIVIIYR